MEKSDEWRREAPQRAARLAKEKGADEETAAAIRKDLPVPAAEFLESLDEHPEYDFKPMRNRLKILFQDKEIGGADLKAKHWYFSQVFVSGHDGDGEGIMQEHGFEHRLHGDGKHHYWVVDNLGGKAFREALPKMTGIAFD